METPTVRRVRLLAIGFLVASLASLWSFRLTSLAAPAFTVNSDADVVAGGPLNNGVCETSPGNGVCTLRAAIMKANHYPGGGVTIHLPAGIYSQTIFAAAPDDESSGDLNFTQTLTLTGAGANTTIVDCSGNAVRDRAIQIALNAVVSISGLTIRHWRAVSQNGGAILNSGTLTLSDSVLSDNLAEDGGGIANFGTLTLDHTTVSNNAALDSSLVRGGGGIDNHGTLMLDHTTVSDNNALKNGGGIENAGSLRLNASTISDNWAGESGGGIEARYAASASVVTITGSIISDNYAASNGGGIVGDVSLTLAGSTLSRN